jgi:energy-coupling factor transport system permease protein
VSYRRRPSALHAARADCVLAYLAALALAALMLSPPLVLGGLLVAVLAAGRLARVGRELRRALVPVLFLGVVVAAVNALVTRDGLTVIARFGDVPLLGNTDVTLEATVYGVVLGLRAAVLVLLGALYTLAVDPDEVLRLFRRVSFRSALTASLATRLVPVLLRDARRFGEAQRCRPGPPPSRLALVRVSTTGAFDRALDVAAALETRGYGAARRPPRARREFSRHDIAFALAAAGIVAVALVAPLAGLTTFSAYPALHAPVGFGTFLTAAGLLVLALLPFLDRRGLPA